MLDCVGESFKVALYGKVTTQRRLNVCPHPPSTPPSPLINPPPPSAPPPQINSTVPSAGLSLFRRGEVPFYRGRSVRAAFLKTAFHLTSVCLWWTREDRSPSAMTSSAFRLAEEKTGGSRTSVASETKNYKTLISVLMTREEINRKTSWSEYAENPFHTYFSF